MASAVLSGAVVCTALVGCSLFKMTPGKICNKGHKLAEKAGKKPASSDDCLEQMTSLQKQRPKAFDCFAGCIERADTYEDLKACPDACHGSPATLLRRRR